MLTAKPPQRHKPRKLPILALQTNPYLRARGPPQRQTSNPPSKHQSSIRTDTTQRTTNMGRPKNKYTSVNTPYLLVYATKMRACIRQRGEAREQKRQPPMPAAHKPLKNTKEVSPRYPQEQQQRGARDNGQRPAVRTLLHPQLRKLLWQLAACGCCWLQRCSQRSPRSQSAGFLDAPSSRLTSARPGASSPNSATVLGRSGELWPLPGPK